VGEARHSLEVPDISGDELEVVADCGCGDLEVRVREGLAPRRFSPTDPVAYSCTGDPIAIEATLTHARAHLASLCDSVVHDRESVIIRRRGAEDVALVSATELRSLKETAHLLSSPKNAARLLTALNRATSRK